MNEGLIRNLTKEEFEESLRMSAFAFQYDLKEDELPQRLAAMKAEQLWGYFADGQLCSKMTILDLDMWVQGKSVPMGGIAGVATWPEHRRGGMVGKLLRNALSVMRANGQLVSCLHPFEFPFYRKYGWESFNDYKEYELSTQQLPAVGFAAGKVRRIGRNIGLLNGIYEQYASRFSGTLVRTEDWWTNRVLKQKELQIAVYYSDQDEAKGYIVYKVRDRVMDISELVWTDEEAWKGLWTFISNHDSMINKVKLRAPADDQLPARLSNPRCKQEIVPYFMGRIVDAAAFMGQYSFTPTGETYSVRLTVEDQHAPWNDGSFIVTIGQDGRAAVKREEEGDGQAGTGLELACGIQALSSMMIGYMRPRFAGEIGRLSGSAEAVALWERLLPPQRTYLMDYF